MSPNFALHCVLSNPPEPRSAGSCKATSHPRRLEWTPTPSSNTSAAATSSTSSARLSICAKCFHGSNPTGWPGCSFRYPSRSWSATGKARWTRSTTSPMGQSSSGPALLRRTTRCAWRRRSSPRPSSWSMICRRGRATTLCAIPKGRCAAPKGGSRPRSLGCANFATAKGSSTLARLPTPPWPWPAASATRSSAPTPNYPP